MSISVVINTLNGAKLLKKTLNSVSTFADEVVVVDMESEDNSRQIALEYGAKVYTHKRLLYVEPARNFGIEKAKSDWILIIDPDEEIPSTLGKKLREISENNLYTFVRVPRKNIIFGKWIKNARWWPDYNIRFFRKGYVKWDTIIHSVPSNQGDGYELPVIEENAIIHHHYETVEQYIERMNRYTSVQASNLIDQKYVFHWHDIITRPSDEFFSRFFYGEAWRDGVHGLALSTLQAVSELVLYLKVWQLSKFKESLLHERDLRDVLEKSDRDLHYWIADFMLRHNDNLIYKIRRKLKL